MNQNYLTKRVGGGINLYSIYTFIILTALVYIAKKRRFIR